MKTKKSQGRSTRKTVIIPAQHYQESCIIENVYRKHLTPLGNNAYAKTTESY